MSDRFVPIGFDARQHPDQVAFMHGGWNVTDGGPALSTDDALWPNLWDAMRSSGHPLEPPDWRGRRQNLWDSLPDMDAQLMREDRELLKPYWQIAIAWDASVELPRQIPGTDLVFPYSAGALMSYTDPLEIDPGWELLGYDVSDFWLLSGLTNCQLSREPFDGRHDMYERDLNRNILFRSLNVADQYRLDADRRVPEHAPFFVYGVYKIREIT